MKKLLLFIAAGLGILAASAAEPVPLADPFVLLHEGTYYAYGTHAPDGIEVYTSQDLQHWRYAGLALKKEDARCEKWFWAPEVYRVKDGFLMYVSLDEHICAARADSPLGPFRQVGGPMLPGEKSIDHTLFIDDDGTPRIFFDRFIGALTIWTAELEPDLVTIRKETLRRCIFPEQPWERRLGKVNEGAAVLKHGGKYYLTYSGNGYTSPEYGIGCAVAERPEGPWVKDRRNPLLQRVGGLVGVGHHGFFTDKEGKLRVAFHAHFSKERIHPRLMYLTTAGFVDGDLVISPDFTTPELVK